MPTAFFGRTEASSCDSSKDEALTLEEATAALHVGAVTAQQRVGSALNLSKHVRGITPVFVVGLPVDGAMRVDIEWAKSCKKCRALISEHNSGMANLVAGKRSTKGQLETIELPAKAGLYFMIALSESGGEAMRIKVNLTTGDSKPVHATRHGIGWQRMCED